MHKPHRLRNADCAVFYSVIQGRRTPSLRERCTTKAVVAQHLCETACQSPLDKSSVAAPASNWRRRRIRRIGNQSRESRRIRWTAGRDCVAARFHSRSRSPSPRRKPPERNDDNDEFANLGEARPGSAPSPPSPSGAVRHPRGRAPIPASAATSAPRRDADTARHGVRPEERDCAEPRRMAYVRYPRTNKPR